VVECDLAKVEVAGSNPVSRSIISVARIERPVTSLGHVSLATHRYSLVAVLQGAVPKW
jgi:hypothetical protein